MVNFFKKNIFILAFVLLNACHISVEIPKSITSKENNLEGYYVFGHEANTFQPCNSKKVYWVIASDDIYKSLESQYFALTSKPYEEVSVQFDAIFKGKATDGFAEEYDGVLEVIKVLSMKNRKQEKCK